MAQRVRDCGARDVVVRWLDELCGVERECARLIAIDAVDATLANELQLHACLPKGAAVRVLERLRRVQTVLGGACQLGDILCAAQPKVGLRGRVLLCGLHLASV